MAAAVTASPSLSRIVKDEILNCSICKNRFEDPRLLICGHSFCLKCLTVKKQGTEPFIRCTMCRNITKLPSKKVETLKKSRTVIGIMDFMKQTDPTPKKPTGRRKPILFRASNYSFDGDTHDDDSSDENISSDDEDSSENDDYENCPPTPGIQTWGGIKKDQKVFIFGRRGQYAVGKVRVIENVHRSVLCGLELEENRPWLRCKVFEKMAILTDTYLQHWLDKQEKPCTVVKIDQCCPMDLIDEIRNVQD